MKIFYMIAMGIICLAITNSSGKMIISDQNSLLHIAVKHNYTIDQIEKIITQNKDILDARDIQLRTPLHWAAVYANRPVVDFLLSKGAAVNVQDYNGDTPLHLVNKFMSFPDERKKIIQILMENGANVYRRNNDGYSAIEVANFFDYRDCMLTLLFKRDSE